MLLTNVPISLAVLRRAERVYPNKVSVVHGSKSHTWSETARRSRQLASALTCVTPTLHTLHASFTLRPTPSKPYTLHFTLHPTFEKPKLPIGTVSPRRSSLTCNNLNPEP